MLVSVNRSSSSYPILVKSGVFGINVLSTDHSDVATRFAGAGGAQGVERYGSSRWATQKSGAWLLSDALAAFDCEVEEVIERHTHTIVIGRVKDLIASDGPGALIYWRGGFDQIGWSREEVTRAAGSIGHENKCLRDPSSKVKRTD
jgi:flavin reductase (DIM6/NTAB) family NADH-FMN oxidoreductase RutF